mgnify:FL=1
MNSTAQLPYALVTGASYGIGFALTQKLLKTHRVIAVARTWGKLESLESANLNFYQCDLSITAQREDLISYIKETVPHLNLLVNNAGVQRERALDGNQWQQVSQEIELNLNAPIHLTTALKDMLGQAQGAVVVHMGSVLGFCHRKASPIYSVTKAAIHQFSRVLSREAPEFRSIEFIPPMIATDMTKERGHKGLMSAQDLASFMLANLHQSGTVFVGKAKLASLINKLAPSLLFKMMNGAKS